MVYDYGIGFTMFYRKSPSHHGNLSLGFPRFFGPSVLAQPLHLPPDSRKGEKLRVLMRFNGDIRSNHSSSDAGFSRELIYPDFYPSYPIQSPAYSTTVTIAFPLNKPFP